MLQDLLAQSVPTNHQLEQEYTNQSGSGTISAMVKNINNCLLVRKLTKNWCPNTSAKIKHQNKNIKGVFLND